jgi:hypothetical protein
MKMSGRQGGIRYDHVAIVEGHFEIAYTVSDPSLVEKVMDQPKASCFLATPKPVNSLGAIPQF